MASFLTLVSCSTPSEEPGNEGSGNQQTGTDAPVQFKGDSTVDPNYVCEGTATVGPYTVYNEDGTVLTGSGLSVSNPNTSMYNAIRLAGEQSGSKNKNKHGSDKYLIEEKS